MSFVRKNWDIIWMNSLTYRPRLKKDLWSKFHLGPKVRTLRQAQSGIRAKIHSWSTIHCVFKIRLSRSTTDGTGLLQWTDTTHESNPEVRHAALIINFPTYIARLSILCMMHRNVPYKHYTANPLELPQKSTIRALFNAKSVDLKTYSSS